MKRSVFFLLYVVIINTSVICKDMEHPYIWGQYGGDKVVVFGNDPVIYKKPDQKSKRLLVPVPGTCESFYGDIYFYFDGKNLRKAFEVITGSSDSISESARVYLPSTGKSESNQVVVKTAAIPIYNELKVKPKDVTIYTVNYRWNGKSFIKGQEIETTSSWKAFKKNYPEFGH